MRYNGPLRPPPSYAGPTITDLLGMAKPPYPEDLPRTPETEHLWRNWLYVWRHRHLPSWRFPVHACLGTYMNGKGMLPREWREHLIASMPNSPDRRKFLRAEIFTFERQRMLIQGRRAIRVGCNGHVVHFEVLPHDAPPDAWGWNIPQPVTPGEWS